MKIFYYKFIAFFLFTIAISFQNPLIAIDFDSLVDDLIIDTKKIEIPDYPIAFNPSIVKWKGNYLLSFRVQHWWPSSLFNEIGLIWLDKNLEPLGSPQILNIRINNPDLICKAEDARLFRIGDRLFIIYNDNDIAAYQGYSPRRMYIAEIQFKDQKFSVVKQPERISNFPGEAHARNEKNWVPFEYQGNMLLSYTLLPHRVFLPFPGTGKCEEFSSSFDPNKKEFKWKWGELRGGTPALLVDGEYLAFFHTRYGRTPDPNDDCWIMGAYTFDSHPPFAITRVSSKPIVRKEFYNDRNYVIFPGGFILDGPNIWVAYGRYDREIWIGKIHKPSLYQSMSPL